MAEGILQFKVSNDDIEVVFSCANHDKRIDEAIKNLRIDRADEQSERQIKARFASTQKGVSFQFNDEAAQNEALREAVFFENTDYPLFAHAIGETKISDIALALSKHKQEDDDLKDVIRSNGSMFYGALNFKNQVGLVDFEISYTIDGKAKMLSFTTEVLSYKMNYRTDLKAIIADIEREYSMLSYSFLKQTYLSFKTKQGQSTELIWWQIFQSCYEEIIKATEIIITSPRRKLRTAIKYERAERLHFLSPEQENEYAEFKNEPKHLYRTEELYLSNDTIENRFLKHVVKELHRRFCIIHRHISNSLNVSDQRINVRLAKMEHSLLRLSNHRFFKGIGVFKGFAQDSMIMKQTRGYKDIYRCWIELQCGYELEDGMHRLEVKDISDLYEMWCFIKVKNIVNDILGGMVTTTSTGKELTSGFIRQLVYGQQSEIKFSKGNIELVSLMYNAQEEKESSNATSAIKGTKSLTTIQRPDIVLRLTKTNDNIQYTYLFDAKYRIDDNQIDGKDVPPVDAINQMHRYRDAIYYEENDDEQLKREVIGGYVLYPGNMTSDEFGEFYYKKSIDRIGIGAFPLKPTATLDIDPTNSENALRRQIKQWLDDDMPRTSLLMHSIPQKGLEYNIGTSHDIVLVNYANAQHWNAFIKNKLCYLRTADSKGAVKLPSFGKEPKYLLLHNGRDLFKLYRLKQDGAVIYTKEQLSAKGFAPSQDGIYLCYKIMSSTPVIAPNLDCKALVTKNAVPYTPHFEVVKRIVVEQEAMQE